MNNMPWCIGVKWFSVALSSSMIEHHQQLCLVLSSSGLPLCPKGALSFQLPPITALIRVLSFPQRPQGLMPTLSGPRQRYSSQSEVTAVAWERHAPNPSGTRLDPRHRHYYSMSRWEEGGLGICYNSRYLNTYVNKCDYTAVCVRDLQESARIQECCLGAFYSVLVIIWSRSPLQLQWVSFHWLCSAH